MITSKTKKPIVLFVSGPRFACCFDQHRLWEQNVEPLWHCHTRTSTTLVGKRLIWVAILAAFINAAFVFGTLFRPEGP